MLAACLRVTKAGARCMGVPLHCPLFAHLADHPSQFSIVVFSVSQSGVSSTILLLFLFTTLPLCMHPLTRSDHPFVDPLTRLCAPSCFAPPARLIASSPPPHYLTQPLINSSPHFRLIVSSSPPQTLHTASTKNHLLDFSPPPPKTAQIPLFDAFRFFAARPNR